MVAAGSVSLRKMIRPARRVGCARIPGAWTDAPKRRPAPSGSGIKLLVDRIRHGEEFFPVEVRGRQRIADVAIESEVVALFATVDRLRALPPDVTVICSHDPVEYATMRERGTPERIAAG